MRKGISALREIGNVGFSFHVKINGGDCPKLSEGFSHGGEENLEDGIVIFKLYLRLRGMDVHVKTRRVHFQTEEEGGLKTFGNETFVGRLNGFGKIGVTHEASVGKEELSCSLSACGVGSSDKTTHFDEGSFCLHGHKSCINALPKETDDAPTEIGGGQTEQEGVVTVKRKGHFGVCQDDALKLGHDVPKFRLV